VEAHRKRHAAFFLGHALGGERVGLVAQKDKLAADRGFEAGLDVREALHVRRENQGLHAARRFVRLPVGGVEALAVLGLRGIEAGEFRAQGLPIAHETDVAERGVLHVAGERLDLGAVLRPPLEHRLVVDERLLAFEQDGGRRGDGALGRLQFFLELGEAVHEKKRVAAEIGRLGIEVRSHDREGVFEDRHRLGRGHRVEHAIHETLHAGVGRRSGLERSAGPDLDAGHGLHRAVTLRLRQAFRDLGEHLPEALDVDVLAVQVIDDKLEHGFLGGDLGIKADLAQAHNIEELGQRLVEVLFRCVERDDERSVTRFRGEPGAARSGHELEHAQERRAHETAEDRLFAREFLLRGRHETDFDAVRHRQIGAIGLEKF